MKDLNITVENGIKKVEILTGKAIDRHPNLPVEIDGTITAPLTFLKARKNLINKDKAFITYDLDKAFIQLTYNEHDKNEKSYICGCLSLSPVFLSLGINESNFRTPFELAEFFKMNRSYFENRQSAMELVTTLRSFKAKINNIIEQDENPNKGDRTALTSRIVDSNLPPEFNLVLPIFRGQKKRKVKVETYFNPKDLTCSLVSPDAAELIIDLTESAIIDVVDQIKELGLNIPIIEQ